MSRKKKIITGKKIEIAERLARHEIVQKVVNAFIQWEHDKREKGVVFRYPVEDLPEGDHLFIERPGHKKNFDFKVDVVANFNLGGGSHREIAERLKQGKRNNPDMFRDLMQALADMYTCTENDADRVLANYPSLNGELIPGTSVAVLLKVLKWLFIMEDIIYWDNEGRGFLFNFLRYVVDETDDTRLSEALKKIRNPDHLKSFMKKSAIEWLPVEGAIR